ncbi:MAG: HRDC domain-containing protein, partial [Synergistaceae bacterium]|nr:HRDC domain-containing protein [Synergistaceae bacterium]
YGMKMVIDTLRGSKSEKIISLGLDKLSTYGICKESNQQLRAVMHHLILSGYLVKTDSEYPVIMLGERADEVLRGGGIVQMKLPKEKGDAAAKPEKRKTAKIDRRLFDVLRDVRRAIASEHNLPAFVIFHDSTLIDMCMKTPATREALLSVSGVGQTKAERWGKRFTDAISDFLRDNELDEMPSEPPPNFDPSAVEVTGESVTVSVVADRINCVLIKSGRQKISGKRINDWLVAKGYMTLVARNNKSSKIATEKGIKLGISVKNAFISGEQVKINLFGRSAQEYIIANSTDMIHT